MGIAKRKCPLPAALDCIGTLGSQFNHREYRGGGGGPEHGVSPCSVSPHCGTQGRPLGSLRPGLDALQDLVGTEAPGESLSESQCAWRDKVWAASLLRRSISPGSPWSTVESGDPVF